MRGGIPVLLALALIGAAGIGAASEVGMQLASRALAAIVSAMLGRRSLPVKSVLIAFVSMSSFACAERVDVRTTLHKAGGLGECTGLEVGGGACESNMFSQVRALVAERPVLGAVAGTSFGWFMTALGAASVVVVQHPLLERSIQQVLDMLLGVAAGVMIAASYWSLLAPALAYAEEDGYGALAFVPVSVGFLAGGALLHASDWLLERYGAALHGLDLYKAALAKPDGAPEPPAQLAPPRPAGRGGVSLPAAMAAAPAPPSAASEEKVARARSRVRRMLQLIIAITAHNAPEGLAVGVAFGALSRTGAKDGPASAAGLGGAISLALGIGLQNFPEGMAVALPLLREGVPYRTAFAYGQLSGVVEPIAGLLGALFVTHCRPLLPFSMALAAGAMIYVVADSLIPEMHSHGNRALATQGLMLGFVTMMVLDVALG